MGGLTLGRGHTHTHTHTHTRSRPGGLNPGLRVVMSPGLEKPPPSLEPWFPQHAMRGLDDSRSLSPGQPRLWSKGGYRMGKLT